MRLRLVSFLLFAFYNYIYICIKFFCYAGALLQPNGLHIILEMFAAMIQSGKDVFIDQNTKLKIYTFSPPNTVGGKTRFFTSNISFAFVLGLAHLKEDQTLYLNFRQHGKRLLVVISCLLSWLKVYTVILWDSMCKLWQHGESSDYWNSINLSTFTSTTFQESSRILRIILLKLWDLPRICIFCK